MRELSVCGNQMGRIGSGGIHHAEGGSHCQECLMLDGCLFLEIKTPPWPHHPNCHCTLEPVDFAIVPLTASAGSAYSKFDPYLFDPKNYYKHGKNRVFESWINMGSTLVSV